MIKELTRQFARFSMMPNGNTYREGVELLQDFADHIRQEEQERVESAVEYITFLEEFWGIPERLDKNSKTAIAREKYIRTLKEGKQ